MSSSANKVAFVDSEDGIRAKAALESMAANDAYATKDSYHTNEALYIDNMRTFTEKHMSYLIAHPAVNVDQYLSNLRLMTKHRR